MLRLPARAVFSRSILRGAAFAGFCAAGRLWPVERRAACRVGQHLLQARPGCRGARGLRRRLRQLPEGLRQGSQGPALPHRLDRVRITASSAAPDQGPQAAAGRRRAGRAGGVSARRRDRSRQRGRAAGDCPRPQQARQGAARRPRPACPNRPGSRRSSTRWALRPSSSRSPTSRSPCT